jgi:hypothetical protein
MKKIKLDAKRLHLKKEKIANLTDHGMSMIAGGETETEGECRTAPTTSMPCTYITKWNTCANCPPPEPQTRNLCTIVTVITCTIVC